MDLASGLPLSSFVFSHILQNLTQCDDNIDNKTHLSALFNLVTSAKSFFFSFFIQGLVYELVCVSKHPVLWGQSHFIEIAAVGAAFAGLYKHG